MNQQLELFNEPRVTLLDFTGKGRPDEQRHAANLLAFTKATRLNMTPDLLSDMQAKSDDELGEELAYMATTIRSSWEFVDVTFLIQGVSRAAAQQMTRTRTASYAMQSQRVTDLAAADIVTPEFKTEEALRLFEATVKLVMTSYSDIINSGEAKESARALLPMNVTTNLVAKYNLRSFVDLVTARQSPRVQKEYRSIVDQMKSCVLSVWPWSEPFFEPKQVMALNILAEALDEVGLKTGEGPGWKIAKAMDLLK